MSRGKSLPHGREQDERERLRPAVTTDLPSEGEAIHVGHLVVQQNDVVGISAPDPLEAFVRRSGLPGQQPPSLRLQLQHPAVRTIVIDDQHSLADELAVLVVVRGGRRSRLGHDGEMKRRPLADLALRPDTAAHQLAQALADGEPESRAPVAARGGGIGLAERLEEATEPVRRYPDARVAHGEVDLVAGSIQRRRRHRDHDLARLGELDRVAQEVDQDLPQAPGVADEHRRHRALEEVGELQALLGGVRRQELDRLLHASGHVHRRLLELELSRFDLREVENVVDDG